MTKTQIINSVTRGFHKVGFQLKKHSPEILVVAGVVGTVASAVMACRATTKVSGILEKSKKDIDTIHECVENPELAEEYTVEDSKKDLTIVYAKTGFELVKLYAPSVILGALSITGIVASHHILRKRNVALAAAYMTVDKGFKEYRGRVIDRFGKELDRELRYNIKAKEYEETVVNEDGTESTITKTVEVAEIDKHSEFAKCFDEACPGWEKNAEFNLMYLRHQQEFANKKLRERGHLFLNEVYDMLGFPRTKAGNIMGWIYDENDPTFANYVDFGMYDSYKQGSRDFVNGYERCVWLDFNVDGPILSYMQ